MDQFRKEMCSSPVGNAQIVIEKSFTVNHREQFEEKSFLPEAQQGVEIYFGLDGGIACGEKRETTCDKQRQYRRKQRGCERKC